LPRSHQVARNDRVELLTGERACKIGGLREPFFIERQIGLTLKAALRVPTRRPVTDKDDF
jgi:hypothetical protein